MNQKPKSKSWAKCWKIVSLLSLWFAIIRGGGNADSVSAQGLTFTTSTYDAGNRPESIVAVDLNGDGKVDLAWANSRDNSISVMTNDGSGGFALATTLNVGAYPNSLTAADVNGDGKMDLICANTGDNTISVLTNAGYGNFTLASLANIGGFTYSLTAADINGDGSVDLICANEYAGTLQILTNDGSGNFTIASTLAVGCYPSSVVAADVNGDGKMDLICANAIKSVSVFTNDGNGGFGLSSTPETDYDSDYVIAADINGDGKVDLITANWNSISLSVLTNDGSGNFSTGCTIGVLDQDTRFGCPDGVAAADMNGDGKVDLICANWCAGLIQVFTNDGSGGFTLATAIQTTGSPAAVTTADVNGDGKMDVISVNGDNTLTVLANTSFFPPPTVIPSLTMKFQGQSLRVAWPSASSGWSLQQSMDLTFPNWSPSGYGVYPIADDGTNKCLTVPTSAGNLFFRLLHP